MYRRLRGKRVWTAVLGLGLVTIAGGFYAAGRRDPGPEMTRAAEAFLDGLSDQQRAVATMGYDDPRRLEWHFFPKPQRKGLQLRDMSDRQRELAHKLLQSALSEAGCDKAETIMDLEQILHALEKGEGRFRRDHLKYYFTIFGTPHEKGRWGLSVEGHHLSLNFTVDGGHVIAHTPAFFGANPAVVRSDVDAGPEPGTRTLAKEEVLAFKLLGSLSAAQAKRAVIAEKAPRDIRAVGEPQPPDTEPAGLPLGEMNGPQAKLLLALVRTYTGNMPEAVAAGEWAEIEKAGTAGIHFAWAGAREPGVGHYYRVQGPTFVIELANTQPDPAGNPANHVHTIYRSMKGDFAVER